MHSLTDNNLLAAKSILAEILQTTNTQKSKRMELEQQLSELYLLPSDKMPIVKKLQAFYNGKLPAIISE
jgi:hypothetical protein